jgi:hypothetical protein
VTLNVNGDGDGSTSYVLDSSSPDAGSNPTYYWYARAAGSHNITESPGNWNFINWGNAPGGVSITSGQFSSTVTINVTGNGSLDVNFD